MQQSDRSWFLHWKIARLPVDGLRLCQVELNNPGRFLPYLACLLSLPAESYLAEQMTVVDVDAIHLARQTVKRSLAEQLTEQITALYIQNHQNETGELNSAAIGRRRIKNLCLDYLTQLDTDASHQLANEQFSSAKTS
jgi:aminopeptidase N